MEAPPGFEPGMEVLQFLDQIRSGATGFTLDAGDTRSISITVRPLP